jgi:acyl-CoA synthetase (AMP-forming)/AMP-acid ligase II
MITTELLNIATSICPERVAISFEGKKYTFIELSERVNILAKSLIDLGVNKGDRVAFLQVNCSQSVETYFAAATVGAIYVPLNYRAKAQELAHMLNDAEPSVLFLGERYIDLVKSILDNVTVKSTLISLENKHSDMLYCEDLISPPPLEDISTELNPDEATVLLYTAGTTDVPKGVLLSHNSFTIYILENVNPTDPEILETILISVPLYHVAGIQAMLASIYGGRTIVMERQFQAEEWMELVEAEKVSRAMMVPTMLKQVIDHPDFTKRDLSSLKVITYGAAPMPLEVIRKAVALLPGVSFINAFGQTETASTITMLGPEDHVIEGSDEEKEVKLKRLSSIGRALPDIEIKVMDQNGKEIVPGKIGEIVARGARVMNEYWKGETLDKQIVDKDGWVHTGDMGYMDDDWYIYLAGRSSDMIIRGGENISPAEIEAVLYSHPKIEDAAVIGIPNEEWGEQPLAVVVLKPNESSSAAEIMEYCRSKMASYKSPKAVVFVKELPRNPMGKVVKRELREKYSNHFS